MEQVTIGLKTAFVIIALLAVYLFYRASHQSKIFLVLIITWMVIQLVLGLSGFYLGEFTLPPRFIWLIIPPTLLVVALFSTVKGRKVIDQLDIKQLTLLHTIRIPVEIVLYFLFLAKAVPQLMTFEGRNFDILAGITALFVYYFGFVKHQLSKGILIFWNILGLILLLNIVIIAILSATTPFQQFALDQPNIAIAYFPFNWLPSVVVPLVLCAHLATIRQLIIKQNLPF